MRNITFYNAIKYIVKIIAIMMLGIVGIVFFMMYLCEFCEGTFNIFSCLFLAFIVLLTVIILISKKEVILYKSAIIVIAFIVCTSIVLYYLKSSGILEKIKDVEGLRIYVSSFQNMTIILFVLIQFLQVVILPLPSIVTISAGVLLFGAFNSAIYSLLGIILGSLVAFFIGRIFGIKTVKWLVGENTLNKALNKIKGKDKTALTLMFVFPFFPDDLLCFVAGLSSMSNRYFLTVILITRTISIFFTAYSINNSLIPYTTWWGILIWAIIIIVVVLFTIYFSKNSDKFDIIKIGSKK